MQGNFIGLSPTGGGPFPNNQGVNTNSQGTTIGGTSANARNVIAGNTSFGVVLNGNADNATIQGNYIGTDPAGTLDLGNSSSGIIVGTGADDAQVGGTAAGAGNLISGNQSAGIDVNGDDAVVEGNLIGTQADGSTALGNSGSGITVDGAGRHDRRDDRRVAQRDRRQRRRRRLGRRPVVRALDPGQLHRRHVERQHEARQRRQRDRRRRLRGHS